MAAGGTVRCEPGGGDVKLASISAVGSSGMPSASSVVAAVHVPYVGWQPVPHHAVPEPHQLYIEQHRPVGQRVPYAAPHRPLSPTARDHLRAAAAIQPDPELRALLLRLASMA